MSRRSATFAMTAACATCLAAACGSSEGARNASEKDGCAEIAGDVVVFFDRSTSVEFTNRRTLHDDLGALVDSALACPGDQLHVYLIHGRTRGKAYQANARNDLELPADSGTRLRIAREEARYEEARERLRETMFQQVNALVDSIRLKPGLSSNTDLLGTFEVASEAFADAREGAPRRVIYYYSDMYESTAGPSRRDFDQRAPRTRREAETWAREDAELVLNQMNVVPDRFRDAEVRIILGEHGNRAAADAIKFYWLELFKLMGFAPERIRYN